MKPVDPTRPSLLCVGLVLLLSQGCFSPDYSADYVAEEGALRPPVETFGGAPPAPAVCDDDVYASGLEELRFTVRTSAPGGQFAPRNVGAIWIEEGSGQFVKTLERWGKTRAKWLKAFNAASDGNLVDAVTGATQLAHTTHEVVWDLEDVHACEVPHGSYRVAIELTDRSGAGPTLYVPFVKDDQGSYLMPSDAPTFHDLVIELK